ncbi:hypothetical protein FOZ62_022569, partial [Perkinsus olseni]
PEDIDKVKAHFASYGMHLTTEDLNGPDANGLLVLGHELRDNGNSLLLPTYKYKDAIDFDLSGPVSYQKALSLLNILWQAWDLLPWHILIIKNCLTALVSRLRAVNEHKWSDKIDDKALDLLRRWQQLLKVWFDSSELLGGS